MPITHYQLLHWSPLACVLNPAAVLRAPPQHMPAAAAAPMCVQADQIGLPLPQDRGPDRLPFCSIFAIGDNPFSDIAGANAAGHPWVSVCWGEPSTGASPSPGRAMNKPTARCRGGGQDGSSTKRHEQGPEGCRKGGREEACHAAHPTPLANQPAGVCAEDLSSDLLPTSLAGVCARDQDGRGAGEPPRPSSTGQKSQSLL